VSTVTLKYVLCALLSVGTVKVMSLKVLDSPAPTIPLVPEYVLVVFPTHTLLM
jgi:hypothetical protein